MSDNNKKLKADEKDLEQVVGGRHNVRSPLSSTVMGTNKITLTGFQPQTPGVFISASVCKYSPCQGSDCPSYDLCNDCKKQ